MRIAAGGFAVRYILMASTALALVGAGWAQEAPPQEDTTAPDTVVIVGSQIVGARPTEALPVTVVGEEELGLAIGVGGEEEDAGAAGAGQLQLFGIGLGGIPGQLVLEHADQFQRRKTDLVFGDLGLALADGPGDAAALELVVAGQNGDAVVVEFVMFGKSLTGKGRQGSEGRSELAGLQGPDDEVKLFHAHVVFDRRVECTLQFCTHFYAIAATFFPNY